MQKYKNKKTGQTIEVNGILTGKDWEKIEPKKKAKKEQPDEQQGQDTAEH